MRDESINYEFASFAAVMLAARAHNSLFGLKKRREFCRETEEYKHKKMQDENYKIKNVFDMCPGLAVEHKVV